jgi:hypothetical protein
VGSRPIPYGGDGRDKEEVRLPWGDVVEGG